MMTNAQFDALCKLMRGIPHSPANVAARGVLVEGGSQAEAMRATGAAKSTVSEAVSRYTAAHELILAAYCKSR